ncbi:MAG TPA: hypothetical protein DCE42_07535, partial [Myxococcales bacterium]|nr:hypothetical protein [Myxococcales bacterium]
MFAARTHISIVHSDRTRHKRSYKMLSRFLTRRGYLVTWNSSTGVIHLIWRQPQEVQFRRGKQSYSLTLPATMNDPWVKARTILTHFEHFIKIAPDVRLVRSVLVKDPYLSPPPSPPRTRPNRKAQKASQKMRTTPPKRPRKRRRQTPSLRSKRAKTGSPLTSAPKRRTTPSTRTARPKGSSPPRRKPARTTPPP